MKSPFPRIVSAPALTLLELWFRFRREAPLRSAFPRAGIGWIKSGTAWKMVVDGWQPASTTPPKTPAWEEAGLCLMRACPDTATENLVLDYLFSSDPVPQVAARHGLCPREALATIKQILAAFQDEMETRGIIFPMRKPKAKTRKDEDMNTLSSLKEIAAFFNVSVNTVRKWSVIDPNFPVKKTPSGRYVTTPEQLEDWFHTLDRTPRTYA